MMLSTRILIVDDELPVLDIIDSMLTREGYETYQALSVSAALKILEMPGQIALVLCDLMMSERDGISLIEPFKEAYPDTPFVMITGVHDISVALHAIRKGAYDYLIKPFERDQISRKATTLSGRFTNPCYQVDTRRA
jgi:DNA-binding NtrC family response regulator